MQERFLVRKQSGLTSFEDSIWFDFVVFREALKDWDEDKCQYFYEQASNYSLSKLAKYGSWVAAVRNWDRRSPEQWEKEKKRRFRTAPRQSTTVSVETESKPDAKDMSMLKQLFG
jgi:hypothetical protein